jgi:site-specific DNA-methyltransferase (adenine-specific)
MDRQAPSKLCQFFTPLWVAEALVERHFPNLDCADLVIEPSCGWGGFLRGVPAYVPAIGVEIDPVAASIARTESGRQVIVGDFRSVALELKPTAIVGNPPFVAGVFDAFLDRCHQLLPEGGRAGFILPAYLLQTANRVARYADRWSIAHELLPRNAFHGRMRTPLTFSLFVKDAHRVLIGFALYREAADLHRLARPYRKTLAATRGSIWEHACRIALEALGGEADLRQIYQEIEGARPSRTEFWREKIRQTLRVYGKVFHPVSTGRYALVESVPPCPPLPCHA